ncbi:MAG: putative F420-dependent oxidoreductase [Frankiales bacterium]|nr:putative F420-dependent oxidoreductase [Frankiales bacterium]
MELGLHIADFTWSGGITDLSRTLARTARDAEAAGITRITVMDHFWQLGGDLGPYEHEMLEGYTALGFIAAHTEKVRLHCLVAGVIYREPAILAKLTTTLDVLSNGRGGLGVGAGWNEAESRGLGIPFPSTAERFERLEEAIQICLQMWSDSEEPFEGKHYQLGRTLSSPQNISQPRPYLMIGGGGERKTLRMVAQYADACNIGGTEGARKLAVLKQHCDTLGRDYDKIEKTAMLAVNPETTKDSLVAELLNRAELGFSVAYIYSQKITEPAKVVDLLASVLPEIAGA